MAKCPFRPFLANLSEKCGRRTSINPPVFRLHKSLVWLGLKTICCNSKSVVRPFWLFGTGMQTKSYCLLFFSFLLAQSNIDPVRYRIRNASSCVENWTSFTSGQPLSWQNTYKWRFQTWPFLISTQLCKSDGTQTHCKYLVVKNDNDLLHGNIVQRLL